MIREKQGREECWRPETRLIEEFSFCLSCWSIGWLRRRSGLLLVRVCPSEKGAAAVQTSPGRLPRAQGRVASGGLDGSELSCFASGSCACN